MRAFWRWTVVGSLVVPAAIACGASSSSLPGGPGGSSSSSGGGQDDDGSIATFGGGGSGSGGSFHVDIPDVKAVMVADSACKAGFYQGAFTGSYSSYLAFGIPLTVTGNVELTLNQEGTSNQTCMITVTGEGPVTESCSDVFTLSGGTITGVADKSGMIGDATIGGFPYFCNMTGTLDCAKKVLDNGWIECTYCIGPLADGGGACDLIGGRFAGPLTANYNTSSLAFTGGTWNGAEVLCNDAGVCNNGTSPGPDGGPALNYVSPDGSYSFGGPYGGSGDWMATCLDCNSD